MVEKALAKSFGTYASQIGASRVHVLVFVFFVFCLLEITVNLAWGYFSVCSERCNRVSGCRLDDPETCCNEQCVGGCYGIDSTECVACKNVYYQGRCIEQCPPETFKVSQF